MLVNTFGFRNKFTYFFTKDSISLFRRFLKSKVEIIDTYIVSGCSLHKEPELQCTIYRRGLHFILIRQIHFCFVIIGIHPYPCLLGLCIILLDVLRCHTYCVSPCRQVMDYLVYTAVCHPASGSTPCLYVIIAHFQREFIITLTAHLANLPSIDFIFKPWIDDSICHIRLCPQRCGRTKEKK